ncbi:bacteriolytic enzyme, putative [Babesia ovata]|uniref:Bacteriolytic enzyme, putative n=1 Tax=Babesia ovata TaxID=189622 RepID=A0A2H6KBR1_9APIC|nr:bacteriolytic enzyme, putative [Babesia ovata]GBE60399.1 bacteriolytic enzyme, putative [Babesia ovata]
MIDVVKPSLRLIRLLYKTYNNRDISNVCDFELEYGLLCGEDNILHLACYICQELELLTGTNDGAIQDGALRTPSIDDVKLLLAQFGKVKAIKNVIALQTTQIYGITRRNSLMIPGVLLNELTSRRIEAKRSYISSICSKEFYTDPLCNSDVVNLLKKHELVANVEEVNEDTVLKVLDSIDDKLLNNDGVFQEYMLADETVNAIRILSSSLCDEYNERWNLYLVRFDALLKVFLQSKNLKDNEALRTLLIVIHHWRNAGNTRFKKFNIYDIYNASGDILEVRKAYDGSPPVDLVNLYSEHSAVPPEGQLTSFIKRVQISEPTHRLGIPEAFSTKRFFKKFSKH